jgi:hypothetical protein
MKERYLVNIQRKGRPDGEFMTSVTEEDIIVLKDRVAAFTSGEGFYIKAVNPNPREVQSEALLAWPHDAIALISITKENQNTDAKNGIILSDKRRA